MACIQANVLFWGWLLVGWQRETVGGHGAGNTATAVCDGRPGDRQWRYRPR